MQVVGVVTRAVDDVSLNSIRKRRLIETNYRLDIYLGLCLDRKFLLNSNYILDVLL